MIKKAFLLLAFVVFSILKTVGQDSAKTKNTNPIIYAELILGYAPKTRTNIELAASINYQLKKSLFTLRATGLTHFLDNDQYGELGVLYGLRFINGGRSLSYSIGVSYNETYLYDFSTYNYPLRREVFMGVPFEFNIKWFDEKKEKYRILGIFPVGKPFAFGTSDGFKIQGNLSKNSYIAFGIVLGFGFHKQY